MRILRALDTVCPEKIGVLAGLNGNTFGEIARRTAAGK
jgi:hypothetical protein